MHFGNAEVVGWGVHMVHRKSLKRSVKAGCAADINSVSTNLFHQQVSVLDFPSNAMIPISTQAMGFTKAKSKEALEECNNDLQSSLDWLVTNCV
jgi:hypothetical protein